MVEQELHCVGNNIGTTFYSNPKTKKCDPTGTVKASVHHKAIDHPEIGPQLKVGSVIILQDVSFWSDIGCPTDDLVRLSIPIVTNKPPTRSIDDILTKLIPPLHNDKTEEETGAIEEVRHIKAGSCRYVVVLVVLRRQEAPLTKVPFFLIFHVQEIPFLHFRNLQSNGLIGRLPPELGNLRFLQELQLDRNRLQGPIRAGDNSNFASNMHGIFNSFQSSMNQHNNKHQEEPPQQEVELTLIVHAAT
ncbi:uncharacterized protein HKW66_Vig0240830 [Vigna angularis]|uniref:Homologous recombination OB-fold protein OB-fold domain-containing protein n=1 Tax=Phaseolus angularis TaxID=3914 RepID=A0A8T0JFJ2_PHAAN|nr:uncharacterized protein HKW66_Vig0240830 [Vigna angularis]